MWRKRNLKKLWYSLVTLISVVFVTENLLYFTFPGPPSDDSFINSRAWGFRLMNRQVATRFEGNRSSATHSLRQKPKEKFPTTTTKSIEKKIVKKMERKKSFKDVLASSPKASKWIVVLARADCDALKFTKISGWKVVVVGNTPKNCRSPVCVYLGQSEIASLGYTLTEHLPGTLESRKMIGYILAMKMGAKVIYDGECHVVPNFNNIYFLPKGLMNSLAYMGGPYFNPYAHYGFPMLRPRGYSGLPITLQKPDRFKIVSIEAPAIQQGMVNFILNKNDVPYLKLTQNTSITFDRSAPPVFLPRNKFGPISSINTVFLQEAFWALFIPSTLSIDGDIMRGYISQRLLQEIGRNVGYIGTTASSSTIRGTNTLHTSDTKSRETAKLVTSLSQWKCVPNMSFFECAIALVRYLSKLEFLTVYEPERFEVWISSLKSTGHREPTRRAQVDFNSLHSWWNPDVIYKSSKIIPTEILLRTDIYQSNVQQSIFAKFKGVCPKVDSRLLRTKWFAPAITDILLVIIANSDFLRTHLHYTEALYRIHFRHIMYCGSGNFETVLQEYRLHHISFISVPQTPSENYECAIHVVNMNIKVRGYLFVEGNVLLNSHAVFNMPRKSFWFPKQFQNIPGNQTKHPKAWKQWESRNGRIAVKMALGDIQNYASKDDMFQSYISVYNQNVKVSNFVHAPASVFYIPVFYSYDIQRLGRIFRKHATCSELAIPMILIGIVKFSDISNLKVETFSKSSTFSKGGKDKHIIRNFNFGKDLTFRRTREAFCEKYFA